MPKGIPKVPKTHCKWGHEFTPDNTWINNRGGRQCRACNLIRMQTARKLRNPTGKRSGPSPRIPECHPERKHRAFGLCNPCYMKIWCKEHGPDSKRKSKYGLTPEKYKQLYEEQRGMCKICEQRPISHTDHDHANGCFRGLLCNLCNVGLGAFLDDSNVMLRAIEYLRRSHANSTGNRRDDEGLLQQELASRSRS